MIAGCIYIVKKSFPGPYLENQEDYTEYLSYLKELKDNDITLFYLDEEGAIWPGFESDWRKHIDGRFNPQFLDEKDFIFAWG